MSLREFIRQNRAAIDNVIHSAGIKGPLNDEERSAWCHNDETLYNWARSEGVRL